MSLETANTDAPLAPLFLYAYDDLDGVPVGSMSPEDVFDVTDPGCRQAWQALDCLVAVEEAETIAFVFRQTRGRRGAAAVRVLMHPAMDSPAFWRDDLLRLFSPPVPTSVHEDWADKPWIPLVEAVAYAQYENDIGWLFLFGMLDDQRRLSGMENPSRDFRLCQMLGQVLQRNSAQADRRYRLAFRKALPALLPGVTIAKKKPGYAYDKGRADLFLAHQGALLPTLLCREGATIHDVANLTKAIQGYKAPAGYLVAPTVEEGVDALAPPLRFVPFEGPQRT